MDRFLGIDNRRPLPQFASETFTYWFKSRRRAVEAPRGFVVFFNDTFVTYNTPEIGCAAVELLEAAGYRVQLVDKKCCGRPLISKGMLDEAKAHAEWNVARLAPLVARGIPVVGLEPSCLLTLRDEDVELVRSEAGRTRGGSPGRAACSRSSSCASGTGAWRSRRGPAVRRAAPCSTAIATRRRWSARRPRWSPSGGPASR